MALKMMSLNPLDKQFLDDNMLTDEDFLCDVEPVEFSEADMQVLDDNSRDSQNLQLPLKQEDFLLNEAKTTPKNMNYITLNDFLQDYMTDNAKLEGLSNSPPTLSSFAHSPMSDTSVISIPEESQCYEMNRSGADTPPLTPSGSSDSGIDSPLACNPPEPVIVTLNSLPQIAYMVPNTHPLGIKSIKPPVTIKPKLIQHNVKSPFPSNSNGSPVVNVAAEEALVKLPTGVYQVKSPKSPSSTVNQKLCDMPGNQAKRKLTSDSELIGLCEMALKRQTRIMKNRESASLSRKKKKAYVEKLEADLSQIIAENSCLKEENNQLKGKITDLEKELTKLKAAFSTKAMKKTACFMVVLFIMTVNITPFSKIFDKAPVKPQKDLKNHRVGRILLWNEENSREQHNASKSFLKSSFMEDTESSYIVSWEKSYNSTCHHFINKSESIRLENDLLGWVKRVEKKQKQKESNLKTSILNLKTAIPPLPKLQLKSRHGNEKRKDIWAKKKNRNEILIYQTPREDYEDFFDAIHRRDDSFYFVSFSGDHLLLPAIAHNHTLRPRMSFVMPAMTLNESIDSDHYVSMMQIDCEVIDTKLVYIKESVIPPHLKQKHNNTSKSSVKNRSRFPVNKSGKQLHDTTVNLPH